MAKKNRWAFTLVELLVVIVFIGMLAALLLQAVTGAREAARRAKCFNNQEEIAKALAQYEQAKKQLPGYVNMNLAVPALPGDFQFPWNGRTPRRRPPLSWAVTVLPYLGRDDLHTYWRTCYQNPQIAPAPTTGVSVVDAYDNYPPRLGQYLCPSDQRGGDLPELSYVVNCGLPDLYPSGVTGIADSTSFGVFQDLNCKGQAAGRLANIPDGAAETLLLSENLQATQVVFRPQGKPPLIPEISEADVGMVWWPRQTIGAVAPSRVKINGRVELAPSSYTLPPEANRIWYARASSNHPGGVVATFADAHVEFLSQDIDYFTYQQRMCPNDNAALSPPPPLTNLFVPPGG